MLRSFFRLTGLMLGLLLLCLSSVYAQSTTDNEPPPRVTIPLEVAMIYHRLLNTPPAFDQLAMNSPRLENTTEFGRNALLAEEKTKLEKVYGALKRNTPIVIRQPVLISSIDAIQRNLQLKGIDADTPFLFPVGNTTYGVFTRNAAAMVSPLQEPFYKGGIDWVTLKNLYTENQMVIAEMTFTPMGADEQNFTTYQDDVVKPILADMIELRLYHPTETQRLLLVKRDEKAFQDAPSMLGNLVEDDLKEEDDLTPTRPVTGLPTRPEALTPAAESRK
jgi:hypothetical protein